MRRRFLKLVDVRPGERAALFYAFAYFFCLLCAYYLLRPLRDALGLISGSGSLQWLFTATFLVMLALVPVFGALVSKLPRRRFVAIVTHFFSLNLLLFTWLIAANIHPLTVGRVFFVWVSVFNLFAVSIFWSVLADRFNADQGTRLFGFIAAGGTLGAFAGPALADGLIAFFGLSAPAFVAALLLEIGFLCFLGLMSPANQLGTAAQQGIQSPAAPDLTIGGGMFAGITLIAGSPYLIGITLLMLFTTMTSTLLYFEQGRIIVGAFTDTAARARFFARIDLSVSGLTLFLQVLVTGPLLRRFGIFPGLAILPVSIILGFAGTALRPEAMVIALAQGMRRAFDYALARPAREVLFTVVSREAKYKAQNVIETLVYRTGDVAAGWLYALLASLGVTTFGLTLLLLPVAFLWLWLGSKLTRDQQRAALVDKI
ncbi:NTP/NDP exchange transporter [Beijerinckia indica]|uniref:NTP/NDP exchange transporter n=1 Tax=Beijerinckia indica TaxID=533 RepID=UPI0005A05EB2|nr:MFS transporter [Beijerinckia indica]